jgi:hypothetical protein
MKRVTVVIILLAVALGFGVSFVSGLFEQTILPSNLWSGTTNTWGGLPFGWWGYSQVGHVYSFNQPHWFSLAFFLVDVVFWLLISCAVFFIALRFKREKGRKSNL